MSDNGKKAYTTKELAKLGGVTATRIQQLLIDGTIKGTKWGRDWMIPKAEALRWLQERP